MELKRSSGILLHITSLPGPYGIGDLGPSAYEFIDFLNASGHRYWQILPLNPTHGTYTHSPYSSYGAFAGNPLMISPELLEKDGLISRADPISTDPDKIDFPSVVDFKKALLKKAFGRYRKKKDLRVSFEEFCRKQSHWIDDLAMFQVLQNEFGTRNWARWPEEFKNREAPALEKAKGKFSTRIEEVMFHQFLFFRQWAMLKEYAHKKKIALIGDIPFYVNHESVDCWVNPSIFKLNGKKHPRLVSGVPPDYFSETGQLWGTPVFDWRILKKNGFLWWTDRLRQNLFLFDLVRLDHFRAFSASWEVKAGETTAAGGKWNRNPGILFFHKVREEFPSMPFIAEDLGSLDEPVYRLIEKFKFPGMKVLQFAFGGKMAENPYIPFNYTPNNIVYTGTHDNNTSRGWFLKEGKKTKEQIREYSGIKPVPNNVHLILHRMALQSVARLAIIPMQDILGLGQEAVMNIPGSTSSGNWTWRLNSLELPWKMAEELRELNEFFGRTPPAVPGK